MVLEIPAGPLAICQGFWYYPEEGGPNVYAYIGFPGDGNVERIYVPEMLLDERGHNTMVCHAKYLSPRVVPKYAKLPENTLFFVNYFREERKMKKSDGSWNVPVDGSNWSVYCEALGNPKYADMRFGCVSEFRGRLRKRFKRMVYERDSQGRWYRTIQEYSETDWYARDPDDFGPWSAPSSHVGRISQAEAISVFDVNIGRLLSYEPHTFPSPRHFFKFREPEVVEGKARWEKDVQHSFLESHLDAMSRFPKQADNDIANSVEVGKLFAAALLGNEDDAIEYFTKAVAVPMARSAKSAAKALGDLWMGYRYAYSTTKMDVKQRIDYLEREVLYNNTCPKCYGMASLSKRGVDALVRHSFRALPNEADLMSTIKRRLYEGGVMPSLYKGWDLVPFSFIADWVGDMGDYLEGLEGIHHAREYIYSESCFSISYTTSEVVWGVEQSLQMYTRVYELPPLNDDLWNYFDYSYQSNRGPTVKTKLKRVGDVGALSLNFI